MQVRWSPKPEQRPQRTRALTWSKRNYEGEDGTEATPASSRSTGVGARVSW
ncbi:unnamed protein product [Brassica oleracea var. botrytis]